MDLDSAAQQTRTSQHIMQAKPRFLNTAALAHLAKYSA